MEIKVHKHKKWLEQYHSSHHNTPWETFQLQYKVEKETLNEQFDELNSIHYIPSVKIMPHQLEACQKVLLQMHGRAILADEVGLGKTIEACLILKELYIRKMIRKVLIIAPASLLAQWESELRTKFHIYAHMYKRNTDFTNDSIAICSYEHVKKFRKQVEQINYDLLIVDEAHKLSNPATINYQMIQKIRKKYCLLLTATPMKNSMEDIFYLTTIAQPYLFSNLTIFQNLYKHNYTVFKKQLDNVLIRNRRKDNEIFSSERHIETIIVQFSEEEHNAYEHVKQVVQQLNTPSWVYLKQLCSSREACYLSLQKNEPKMTDTLSRIAGLPHHVKAIQLIKTLKNFKDEKIVIFTQYKATQYYLHWYLAQYNIPSILFSGDMNKSRKSWMIDQFKQKIQVLIATDACSEGVNLQFAHVLINYDLPWNPMRLEQRIGRVHRLGQKNDVKIIHFAIENTIETHILHVIYNKIHLFHHAIGKMERILDQEYYIEDVHKRES